jgi:hypothetical protein
MAKLDMKRGDRRTLRIIVTGVNGRPYPWAGVTIWFTAKKSVNISDALAAIHKTGSRDGGDFDLSVDGVAVADINSADTTSLPNKTETYLYDVQIKRPDGAIESVDEGTITISAEVTVAS